MIILGEDAIIIDVDVAQKLLKALYLNKSKADYERLQELGLLDVLDKFRQLVRRHDDED